MANIDVGPLLTKVLNFEGLNVLGPHSGIRTLIPSCLGFFKLQLRLTILWADGRYGYGTAAFPIFANFRDGVRTNDL